MAKDYAATLNLPWTEFPMRANLPQREPEIRKCWDENDLYGRLLTHNEGKESFVLHDGPPFSNGNIHMGTAMNKILKDFIIKSKAMTGHYTPYVPGWDNHGMPIESAIIKRSKLNRKTMTVPDFRKACETFAREFVDLQMTSFKRTGVIGDWNHPYLTMDPAFEAREIKVFGEMYKKGYIYKDLKPVYWCAYDETALAEAEIEYSDDECTSVYVKFPLKDDHGLFDGLCDKSKTYFIIWTTTTWTLPGNLAIALHPREDYSLIKASSGDYYIVMSSLADKTMAAGKIDSFETAAVFKGAQLEYMTASHPFLDRDSLIVNAEYVTSESGTGCVHTAPGFGADDYFTGKRYKLPILVPVDDRGYQTKLAGKYAGMKTAESNEAIFNDLLASGLLFAHEKITHQYPHCWRCKKPIIFRATPQWFVSVDAYKEKATKACDDVEWIPEWGHDRMVSMIRERADWCISRQRHWGLPIPVFYCDDCKKVICTDETIDNVSTLFAAEGSNVWFERDAAQLLPDGFRCPKCGGVHFTKETDTLDGWFDSGSTHFSVLERKGMKWPADLYLEGADQYRGWFQSSLLTAVGTMDKGAPYKQVLTHGWVVDGEGKAMHKSLGNSVAPEEIINKYGADMLRLWVASSDYHVDVRASDAIFKQLSESYRKIRNTLRILLANLGDGDFNPKTDLVAPNELYPLDKWIVSRVNSLARDVRKAYDEYTFHDIYHGVHNFCSIDLSKLYIDISKDRLYTEGRDSLARRSAQTAIFTVLSSLTRLLAPILSYTCEETWRFMAHADGEDPTSVFLNDMPSFRDELNFPEEEEHFEKLFEVRDDVCKALELERAAKVIGKSLEAKIIIYGTKDNEAMKLFEKNRNILETVFIVSEVVLSYSEPTEKTHDDTASGIRVAVLEAEGDKCVRCWMHSKDAVKDEDGQALCPRCRRVLESMK